MQSKIVDKKINKIQVNPENQGIKEVLLLKKKSRESREALRESRELK